MNITSINSTHSNNVPSFGKIKVVSEVPDIYKKAFEKSMFNTVDQEFWAIASSKKVSNNDFGHEQGSKLYRFRITKAPKNIFEKIMCRIGLSKSVYLTRNKHSIHGTNMALKNDHVASVIKKLNA